MKEPPWQSKGVISPRELRVFIGHPKNGQWKALLKRAGLDELPMEPNRYGSWMVPRTRFTLDEARRLLELRYAEIGERRMRSKRFKGG